MISKCVLLVFFAAFLAVFLEAKVSPQDDNLNSPAVLAAAVENHVFIHDDKREERKRRMAETPTKTKKSELSMQRQCGGNPFPFVPVNYRARSCIDHMRKGATHCGYYIINDGTESFTAFCDINSEVGAAYTLVESFALKYNNKGFKLTPLTKNFAVRHNSPRFDFYRLTKDRMARLAGVSTHWRATCNFDQVGFTENAKDYVRVKLTELNPVTFLGSGKCIHVEEFQLRGRLEFSRTAAFWQGSGVHLHHDSSTNVCEVRATPGAASSENNWGAYSTLNPKFGCMASPESTTQIWFGGSI